MITAKQFIDATINKAIDDDGAYGAQCVDGFRVYCRMNGITPFPTKNNWADGYWYYRYDHANEFDSIVGAKNFRDGDWVIWAKGSRSHPSSHIAMYYQGKEYGQNQGGIKGAFSLKPTDFSDALGALRLRGDVMVLDYGYSVKTVGGVTAKVYRAKGLVPVMLSAGGATALKPIESFDADNILKSAVINCNYYQMQRNASDAYGTHYGAEADTRIPGQYTQMPQQAGVLTFWQDTEGNCGVSDSKDLWLSASKLNFACAPYAVRVHEGVLTYLRSTNFGDKDDLQNTQSVLCLLDDDWCVAAFDKCYPRDTVSFFQAFGDVKELLVLDSGGSTQMRALTGGAVKLVASGDGRELPNVIALAKFLDGNETPTTKPVEQTPTVSELDQIKAERDALKAKLDAIRKTLES